jgi:hypothetical protein
LPKKRSALQAESFRINVRVDTPHLNPCDETSNPAAWRKGMCVGHAGNFVRGCDADCRRFNRSQCNDQTRIFFPDGPTGARLVIDTWDRDVVPKFNEVAFCELHYKRLL